MRGLSNAEVQRLCNLNYENEVACGHCGLTEDSQIVAQSCYFINPTTFPAYTAFMVHPDWQGSGSARRCKTAWCNSAKKRRTTRFVADVLPGNTRMRSLARNGPATAEMGKGSDPVHPLLSRAGGWRIRKPTAAFFCCRQSCQLHQHQTDC
ncbi:GNAT family N-acetyltransferase [Candidatus Aalborgicola defluviihabitans]|uniref:GNAT family N-acetyltransferase n=1 Tax=Candidatus Aalborgicola defluviihabitans TaxID=3386187 RepID=UPI001DA8AF90|nr:hypothetical protein [Burkholderiales bacterium]